MTFDYGAEAPPSEFVNPPTLVRCIRLPADQVKLLNFEAKVSAALAEDFLQKETKATKGNHPKSLVKR